NESASRLLFAARQFLDFATTSPNDEPDRLRKLIRLLDALNAAVIEIRSFGPVNESVRDPNWIGELRSRWPELIASYPTALQSEQEWLDGDREAVLGFAIDDLADICREISSALRITDQPAAASHLAWSYATHWIWHAHGLRGFLVDKILH